MADAVAGRHKAAHAGKGPHSSTGQKHAEPVINHVRRIQLGVCGLPCTSARPVAWLCSDVIKGASLPARQGKALTSNWHTPSALVMGGTLQTALVENLD